MINFKILILLAFFSACNTDKNDNTKCSEPTIKPVYFERGCNGDKCGYFHTIMLDTYNENCFNDYNFIYLADKYLDSVTNDLPVNGITFVKPFDFKPDYDSRDLAPIREHSIVDICYTDETMSNKVPEISSISIWTKGKRKELEYMHLSTRQHRMDYYNSKAKK